MKSIFAMKNTVKVVLIYSTQLFQLIICTLRLPEELKKCFFYELAYVALSIFDTKDLLRKIQKLSLYDAFTVEERVPNLQTFFLRRGNLS